MSEKPITPPARKAVLNDSVQARGAGVRQPVGCEHELTHVGHRRTRQHAGHRDVVTPPSLRAPNINHVVVDLLLKHPSTDVNQAMNDGATPLLIGAQNNNRHSALSNSPHLDYMLPVRCAHLDNRATLD